MKTKWSTYAFFIALFFVTPTYITAQEIDLEGDDLTITGPSADIFLRGDGTVRSNLFFGSGDLGVADANIILDPIEKLFKIGDFTGSAGIFMSAAIADQGKIGIGTKNDLKSMVKIYGNSGTSSTPAHLELTENGNSDFARLRFTNFSVDGHWTIAAKNTVTNPLMNFYYDNGTSGTNIMSIDGLSEKVGIKDSSPEFTFEVNHENGTPSGGEGNGLYIKNIGVTNDEDWLFYVNGLNGLNQGHLELYENGTLRGRFDDANGNYNPVSDIRFKENVNDLADGQLETVMSLRPTSYNMKNHPDSNLSYGFIAQEVMEILPNLVGGGKDSSSETELTLSYTQLIPVLTKAIQEQQVQIEELIKEVKILKGE